MAKVSAGILLYKLDKGKLKVLLVHLGGPYYKNKDLGFWMIPKGEIEENETPFSCALREVEEEIGLKLPNDFEKYLDLGETKQKGGKIVYVFAIEHDFDGFISRQSFIEIEYPKGSGKRIKFPEIDKISFFYVDDARKKILKSQEVFLDRLIDKL